MTTTAAPEPRTRELLTAEEVAELLRVEVHTLHNWRYRRVGPPAYKVAGKLRYDRAAVDEWLEGQAS